MMRRLLAAALLSLSLGVLPTAVSAQPTEREVLIETFARISQSVGALYALRSDGDLTFLCSATAVDRRYGKTVVMTANHCIRKGVAYLINFGDNNFRSLRVWMIPHYEIDADEYPRRYNEPLVDIALFLMDGQDVPVVPISDADAQRPGTKIAMVGFPKGVAKIRYEGIISGYLDRPGADDFGYLLLQIFGAPGSSGSAVVELDQGGIVGVLVRGTVGEGLPVIFATPTSYMENLMIVPGALGYKKRE